MTPVRADLPSGTVTFLFTDLEGSTKLLHELGADHYAQALAEHRRLLREAFSSHGGVEVDTQGDAFFVAFPTAPGALRAAAVALEGLPAGSNRVRMGIHTGTPYMAEEGYVGADVHRAARIAACGHGGQVLVSASTAVLLGTDGLRDLGEHRLKDLSAPERIYQLGDDDFPPLQSLHQTNLPIPSTPFLGREQELTEVLGLLSQEGVHLLTLTGPGGTGKTRLAGQAAAELAAGYPHGVWWVPLASLRDPKLVLETAGQALGAKGDLAEHIADRSMLLLFDNFEHVVEAAADVAGLRASCPKLDLLVTSREPLHVTGEQEYPVPPLVHEEGVGFFLASARAVKPDFRGDDAVSDICRRLDDLPLALELAAARVKALSSAQILERLEQRLPLLTGGARDLPERQRTLRATIEWSYELLAREEQRLFARLAVFGGGCTLEVAEELTEADLDTLQSLVDKSLLRHTEDRFWMLETIREYATEQLEESGEAEEQRRRHAAYCLKLAEQAESELTGPDQTAWLNRLDMEYGNLREALRVCLEQGDPETALRLGAALWGYLLERGYLSEGRRWLSEAHEASTGVSAATRANALNGAGILAHYQGDYGQAQALCRESLALYRELNDEFGIAGALSALALATRTKGEFAAAQAMFEEALAIFSDLNDKQGIARTLDRLGIAVWFQGDDDRARGLLDESLAAFRKLGDAEGIGLALVDLGLVALSQADYGRARPLLEESLAAFKEVGDRRNACKALYAFGDLAGGRRDYARAAECYAESLGISLDLGVPWFTTLCLERLAGVAVATGDPKRAARLFGASDVLREAIGAPMPAYFRSLYERDLADTRARLDEERFDTAWQEGRAMPLQKAISAAQVVTAAMPSAAAADDLLESEDEQAAPRAARE